MIKSQWRSQIKSFNKHSYVPEGEWEENTKANLPRFHKSNSLWRLKGLLDPPKDKAVVVVGTSPVLKSDVSKLKQCDKDDFLIVTVNSALKIVLDAGVTPDYVIAIDSDYEDIYKHLDVSNKTIPLITCNILSPKVLDMWKGLVWFFPYFAVSNELKKKLKNRLGRSIPVGGNALGSMVSIAMNVFHARIIILVASECCYDKNYYPSKKIARNNLPATEFFVNDINGKRRVTTTPLHTYKLWMERLATQMHPLIKIIDTSAGILGKRDDKSKIYTYELTEIIDRVKKASAKKRELIDANPQLFNASLYQPKREGAMSSTGSRPDVWDSHSVSG